MGAVSYRGEPREAPNITKTRPPFRIIPFRLLEVTLMTERILGQGVQSSTAARSGRRGEKGERAEAWSWPDEWP